MPQGLQIFDANGNIRLTLSDKTPLVFGYFPVTGDGSLSDSRFLQGTPFYAFIIQDYGTPLVLTFNSTTLSWNYGAATYKAPGSIIYGII